MGFQSHVNDSLSPSYKSNSHARTGKHVVTGKTMPSSPSPETSTSEGAIAKNLRDKQLLVLKYFVEHEHAVASPSMIVYWMKQNNYIVVEKPEDFTYFCKKLYDTITSLVKRGLLVRVKRGYYALSDLGRKLAPLLVQKLQGRANRESDLCSRSVVGGCGGCGSGGSGFGGVLRFHLFSGGGGDVGRLVVGVELVYRYVLWLRRYLRGVLGVSVYRRLASGVSLRVVGKPVVGVHGGGGFGRALKPLSYAKYGFSEVGVDVPVEVSVGRFHVKVYLAPLHVYLEHLERFKPRMHAPLSGFAVSR